MIDKELNYFAASLSFYTLSTIVPLFLIVLTILTHLKFFTNFYLDIKKFLFENFMPIHSEKIMSLIDQFINNSFELGIVSFIIMLFSSFMFFQNFEYIANKIFKVKEKNIFYSFSTYLIFVTIIPIGIGIAFYITFYLNLFLDKYEITSSLTRINLSLLPYVIIFFVFLLIYKISINKKIPLKVEATGALINAVIWVGAKNMFIIYVITNESYKTIYGSFSFILYFLLWIYVSWLIFIYGIKLLYLIYKYNNFIERKN
jgi:membrane protein